MILLHVIHASMLKPLSEMQATMSEADNRLLTLVDDEGWWIKCCAIGTASVAIGQHFFLRLYNADV